jgi:hypothetical protein
LPFDGTDFQPGRRPIKRSTTGDNVVSAMIIANAVMLLATPFSLSGLVDIVEYIRGG